ncbi:hypothetical protein AB1N83_012838 [Pleurotus pulmonarius]
MGCFIAASRPAASDTRLGNMPISSLSRGWRATFSLFLSRTPLAHRQPFCMAPYGTHNKLSHLPLELIDYIIVSLDDDKDERSALPTLKACSLTCRMLNDICRPHIFRDFTIDLSMTIYKIAFLHFNAPHLFEYITNLTIIVWGADVQDTPAWILDALHQFVNLRSLTITNTMRDGPSPPSMSAIMSLIAKAPLRTLVLERWDFSGDASSLLHILALCSSTLEELSLAWCYIHTPETFPKPVNAELPPVIRLVALRRIRLSRSDLPASQLNRLEIPNLDFLSWAYVRYPLADIQWIPASLSTVALSVTPDSDLPRLSRFIRPSCLTMTVRQSDGESLYLPAMTWISRYLACLPFPHELRQLNINIEGRVSIIDGPRYPTRTDYQELYCALQSLYRDGALERINLTHRLTSLTRTVLHDIPDEAPVLNEVFRPLLGARPLVIDITLEQWVRPEFMPVAVFQHRLQCSSGTADYT